MSFAHYNSNGHDDMYDTNFTADISNRMQVPKRIRIGGNNSDGDPMMNGNYGPKFDHHAASKYEMRVPDRILVVGQDKHVGMKAPPQELILENSILTADFPPVRVRTPPRSITVDNMSTGYEEFSDPEESIEEELSKPQITELVASPDANNSFTLTDPPQLTMTSPQLTEEVIVLRQQIGRLHRRMTSLEREQQQRQQRDALMISIGAVYMVWKVILWLTRSP
uniref:Mitochondrial fission factor n=1 Tax=Evadne anonyx TaxID=141404 RepID=A0A9N6WXF9_9CRUS|nr:EOG090X08OG [Evadne anonyx]